MDDILATCALCSYIFLFSSHLNNVHHGHGRERTNGKNKNRKYYIASRSDGTADVYAC